MSNEGCRSLRQPAAMYWSFQFGEEYALVIMEKGQMDEKELSRPENPKLGPPNNAESVLK